MSKQLRLGYVVRFVNTGNRYTVEMIPNGVSLEPIGPITGTPAGTMSIGLFVRLVEDKLVVWEGTLDEREDSEGDKAAYCDVAAG